MGYITWDHKCSACGHAATVMHDRQAVLDTLPCPECRGEGSFMRVYSVPNTSTSKTSVSIPDGVGSRFQALKDKRARERDEKAAKKEERTRKNKIYWEAAARDAAATQTKKQ